MFVNEILNFGYWKTSSFPTPITVEERFESEKELYRIVARYLEISPHDFILEAGCGFGIGTRLMMHEFNPCKIKGIDISKERIQKANENLLKNFSTNLLFSLESAENVINENESFDKIFSIEAIQHFVSTEGFIKECYRTLKYNGRLAIASIFTASKTASNEAQNLLNFKNVIINWIPINELCALILSNGFKNIQVINIGKNVWQPICQWISERELLQPWSEWHIGYKRGNYDYYIVIADKMTDKAN